MSSFNSPNEIFIHLRVHSSYSLSYGALQIDKIIELAKKDAQPAIAITDNNNMFGALEFSEKAIENGVQPILGCQINVCDQYGEGEIVLIARNENGYLNLINLISDAHLNPNEMKGPMVRIEDLIKRNGGLIILSGGVNKGFIPNSFKTNNNDIISSRLEIIKNNFKDDVYIEIQRHGLTEQGLIERQLINLAYNYNFPIVATNDVCFLKPEMKEAHDVLMCIEAGKTISNTDKPSMTENHYFKTKSEMIDLFKDIPEAIENTKTISQRCFVRSKTSSPLLPKFETKSGLDEKEEIVIKAKEGLKKRILHLQDKYSIDSQLYFERIEMELEILTKMGFSGYYLIVADVVGWAKSNDIPVGPGRGSGAGSIVAWSLGITDLDPIRWGLLFERFLNPERVSMPDFDIDFCKSRRDEVIEYVQNRYGYEKVAQIITFGELKSRAVLRDTGRVLEMPYSQVDRIAKLIPNNPARPLTIAQALDEVEELRNVMNGDEQVQNLISISQKLEGLFRHASTHAAGVVIGHRKIADLVPLYRDPKSDMPATQFNMKWVEKAGLVKFDFLGLQTLTMIKKTIELLKKKNINVDFSEIPLTDKQTFQMLSQGNSLGVFQLESGGMKEVLRGLKPDRFEDIIAIVALYRPGPMDNIPTYISRKHGAHKVEYMHPELEGILKETYGIMIYQEQVQQAAQILAGYTLGAADILRRAMGKKIKSEMDAQREKFVSGASKKSISSDLANQIFDQISAFAGYGFNKSHAAGYAMITYQTAWLRAHFPYEFFSASMSLEISDTDKLSSFVIEAKSHGIQIQKPSINSSFVEFVSLCNTTDSSNYIEYGLSAIKNVGFSAMEELVIEREKNGKFLSLEDFLKRIPVSIINKRMLENLIKSGAIDCVHLNRNQLLQNMDTIISFCDLYKRENNSNQSILFAQEEQNLKVKLNDVEMFSLSEKLENEFSALGLYLSSHPIEPYTSILKNLDIIQSSQIEREVKKRGSGCRVKLAGIISRVQMRTTKRGSKFYIVYMTDSSGPYDFLAFDDIYFEVREFLEKNKPILASLETKVEDSGRVRLNALEVKDIQREALSYSEVLTYNVLNLNSLDVLKEFLEKVPEGHSRIKLFLKIKEKECEINLPNSYELDVDQKEKLSRINGIESTNL